MWLIDKLTSDVIIILKGYDVILITIVLTYVLLRIVKLFFWYSSGR